MSAFAETQQCRMTAVIRHFGDTADAHRPCGQCDFCSPSTTSAQTFAPPTTEQARNLRTILRALAHAPSKATGKLFTDLALGIERNAFEVLLDSLARAGLITLTAETFTNKRRRPHHPLQKSVPNPRRPQRRRQRTHGCSPPVFRVRISARSIPHAQIVRQPSFRH